MTKFITQEVPFVKIGNRRGLTAEQLMRDTGLREFFDRFRHRFEQEDHCHVWVFIEND